MDHFKRTNPGAPYWDEASVRQPVKKDLSRDIAKDHMRQMECEMAPRRCPYCRNREMRERLLEKLKRKKQEKAPLLPFVQHEEATLAATEKQKKKRKRKKKKTKDNEDSPKSRHLENASAVEVSTKANKVANLNEVLEGNSHNSEDLKGAFEEEQKTENQEDTVPVKGKEFEKEDLKCNTFVVKQKVVKREVAEDVSKLMVMIGLKFKKGVCHEMLAINYNACADIVVKKLKNEMNREKQLQSLALEAFSLKFTRIDTARIYLKDLQKRFGNKLLIERTADMKFKKENTLNNIASKKKVVTASNGEQSTKNDGKEEVLLKFNFKVAPQRRALTYYTLKNERNEVVRLQENGDLIDKAVHRMNYEQNSIRRARDISLSSERTVKWRQYEQRKTIVLNVGVGRKAQKWDVSHTEPSKEPVPEYNSLTSPSTVPPRDENLTEPSKVCQKAMDIENSVSETELLEEKEQYNYGIRLCMFF